MTEPAITPALLLEAYAEGYFPMAASRHDMHLRWYSPDPRAILPLERFHIPRSLAKFLRASPFELRLNTAFRDVIRACAVREETWINDEIIALYTTLFERGFAHSVECWQEGGLVGGLYGVSLGAAFFGESMFSRTQGASKAALCHLVSHLKARGFTLLDAQYRNPHLAQFGLAEIPRAEYMERLRRALSADPAPVF